MRFKYKEHPDGWDIYDEKDEYYMNDKEVIDKLNDLAGDLELQKKLLKREKEARV